MQISGPTLKALRELAGYSQAELSRQSGVSQGHISDLEAAEEPSEVRPATVKKLSEALGIPTAALARVGETATGSAA